MEEKSVTERVARVSKELRRPKKVTKPEEAKATKEPGAAKAKKKPQLIGEPILLDALAREAKLSTSKARRTLRGAKIERSEGRWGWKAGSPGLKAARKALGLDA